MPPILLMMLLFLICGLYDMFGFVGVAVCFAMAIVVLGTIAFLDAKSDDAMERYRNSRAQ